MPETFILELSARQVVYLLQLVQHDRMQPSRHRCPIGVIDNLGDKLMALSKGTRRDWMDQASKHTLYAKIALKLGLKRMAERHMEQASEVIVSKILRSHIIGK